MRADFDPEKEVTDAHLMEVISTVDLNRMRRALGEKIPPEQRRFAELYAGECRFSLVRCARRMGMSDRTLFDWRAKPAVQRYMAALMRESASRLAITRDSILGELGRVAFSDVAAMMDDVSEITARLVEELGEDGITGEKIIARLKPSRSAAIKSVKFDSVVVTRTTTSPDGEEVVETRAVPVLKEIQMHDKLSALQTLAPWFGLEPGAFSTTDDTSNLPALFEVLAPERRDDNA